MEGDRSAINSDYTEIVSRLPLKLRLAYGVGHVLNDICASMWFTYLILFFNYVLEFSTTMAGLVLFIGQVADAFATPFVGLHSDKNDDFWLCRYGKRKTWHLLGTVCVLFAFPFIFSQCVKCESSDQWAKLIYYAAFVTIFQFGWASVQISHLSLIPDLTPTDHERTELTALRYSFTVFSNILVYCLVWLILHITGETADHLGPADAPKFQKVVFIGLGVGSITSLIFHIFVQERSATDFRETPQSNRTAVTVLKDFQLYKVAATYMPTRLFVNLSQIYVPMYLHDSLKLPKVFVAIIPLTIYISSFITSLVIERLNTKLGRKIAYVIGALLGLIACTCIWFCKGENYNTYGIYGVSALLGAGGSVMLVTSLGVTADFIGQNTESGFVYGFMSFCDKLSNGLVVMAIQYIQPDDKDQHPIYYKYILAYICGGAALIGVFGILIIRPFVHNDPQREYRNLIAAEEQDQLSGRID